ncbi:putative microtubule-associated protein [Botrytis cinerea BcDW1]|uniref:Mediator of RNA polymerase II transcription subunit 9 n=1 Tax=Botryotinia fuckeliana (strain BcDW1) TaxID=1290391 RepID=M7UF87_BOTF1|nr:putative microtubule-associated protein [Botrytis cinerea BcDW1]
MLTTPSQATLSQTPPTMILPEGLTADYIDTIPVLCETISRLQNFSPSNASAASPPGATPSFNANSTGPLNIKDIYAATDGIKHKLQKARVGVKSMPDMHRTIEDQEEEIRECEEKIAQQKEVLNLLMKVGSNMKKEREERGSGDKMET